MTPTELILQSFEPMKVNVKGISFQLEGTDANRNWYLDEKRQGQTIVLVDNTLSVREGLQLVLEQSGAIVITFSTTPAAREYVEEHSQEIDVVVTKADMPQMDGLTFLKEIQTLGLK